MNRPFRCKQFQVYDHLSTMKVGTDAILLGAWALPTQSGRILDVGTGCGILAMMMAQKTNAFITAIDIHEPSIKQAAENFAHSPWPERLEALNISLQNFCLNHTQCFDFIISNPPFFLNSLKPQKRNLLLAKHTDKHFMDLFLDCLAHLLKPGGKAAFIIPAHLFGLILHKASLAGIHPLRMAEVFSKPGIAASRVMIEAGKNKPPEMIKEKILVRDASHRYTESYKSLTEDSYLFLNE